MEEFIRNDKNRCYYCKKVRFKGVLDVAKKYGILHVADGSNYDDLGDFRPGMKAAEELGVISPLMDVKMTKPENPSVVQNIRPAYLGINLHMPVLHPVFPMDSR